MLGSVELGSEPRALEICIILCVNLHKQEGVAHLLQLSHKLAGLSQLLVSSQDANKQIGNAGSKSYIKFFHNKSGIHLKVSFLLPLNL